MKSWKSKVSTEVVFNRHSNVSGNITGTFVALTDHKSGFVVKLSFDDVNTLVSAIAAHEAVVKEFNSYEA